MPNSNMKDADGLATAAPATADDGLGAMDAEGKTVPLKTREWWERLPLVAGSIAAVYLAAFLVLFDVFGCPARFERGWLGPVLWSHPGAFDAGEVYVYQATAPIPYTIYWPVCKVWLLLQGIQN